VDDNGGSLTVDQLSEITDDTAFTPATTKVSMMGATFDDTTPDSVDEGDGGAVRMSSNRNLYVRIRDNAGNERGLNIDASGNANVAQATASALNAQVVGNVANNGADSGNPVKIGALAYDYHPDASDTVAGGRTEVDADADRVDISANRRGELIEGVNGYWFTLDNVSTIYDDNPTTATSTGKECWNYRWASISFDVVLTQGTPTDIQFDVEVSLNNGTNYAKLYNGPLGLWVYDDTAVTASKSVCLSFPIACTHIRLKVTATGTDATNRFTVSNAVLYLRN